MKKPNDPLEENRQTVESILGSQQAQQIAGALQKLDPQTLEKLKSMAQSVDKKALASALRGNSQQLQNSLKGSDLMAQLQKMLKG